MAIIDQGRARIGLPPLDGPTQTLPDLYALAGTTDFNQINTIGVPFDGGASTSISPAFGSYNPWAGLGSPVANQLAADLIGGKSTISGTVFVNADGSGVPDAANLGLQGLTVFLDANGTGKPVPGEATTTTGPGGTYKFLVAPGNYTVDVVFPPGWTQQAFGSTSVVLTAGSPADATINFALNTPPPPPPPAPSILSIGTQIVGRGQRRHEEVLIFFNTSLNPVTAGRLSNYYLTRPGPCRRSRPYVVPIRSVLYDPATNSVTLSLRCHLARRHMLLSIQGLVAAGTSTTSITTPVP